MTLSILAVRIPEKMHDSIKITCIKARCTQQELVRLTIDYLQHHPSILNQIIEEVKSNQPSTDVIEETDHV